MSKITRNDSFVRTDMLPEQAPPVAQAGALKWMRENLFSSPLNAALTVLSVGFIYWVLTHIVGWLFLGVWDAGSLSECRTVLAAVGRENAACWAVIEDRWLQLLFGFYPSEHYWRPILAVLLMFVALAPVLFSDLVPGKLGYFSILYPFIAVWLVWGGSFWSPLLVIAGFGIGYLAFRLASTVAIGGIAVAIGIVASALWWGWGQGVVGNAINVAVGEPRYEQRLADERELVATLPAAIEAAEAGRDAIAAEIDALVEERDVLSGEIAEMRADDATVSGTLAAAQDELLAMQDRLAALRDDFTTQSGVVGRLTVDLSESRRALNLLEALPEGEEALPGLIATAEEMRDALPSDMRGIDSMLDVPEDFTDEQVAAIEAVLGAEEDVRATSDRIENTYALLALTGLEPVDSRDIGGFTLAIIIGVSGIVLSFPIGIALALGRQSDLFIIKTFCVFFIETIRGVPLIVWLFTAQLLLNYFLPPGTTFDLLLRVVIMVTLFASAYIAEVIRGGLAALPRGQFEGADSLGLDYWQSMRLIILPQALKISIPGIVNTFIGLFKDTTLVVFIGLFDTIGLSNGIRADTDWNGIYWELFIFIGALFFICCYSMSQYSQYLERKLRTDHR